MNEINAPADTAEQFGLNEALIAKVVRHFYGRIDKDVLLGPIFNQAISDWEPHLQTMIRFWSSVMLHARSYEGRPMPKHIVLPIDARHFDHWLVLFGATVKELCSKTVADLFLARAMTIARSLEMGVAFHNGASIKLGERYYRENGTMKQDDDDKNFAANCR